jgi:hypothetical protein
MLAVFAALLWLIVFPALVGLLNGLRVVAGGGWTIAAAAALVTLVLAIGLARQKPWRRPHAGDLGDERPFFVRFSTWLITTLLVPNVLYGVLVLAHHGESLGYLSAWLIGLLVSVIHGLGALFARARDRV